MMDGVIPAVRAASDLVKVVEAVSHATGAIDPMTPDFTAAVWAWVESDRRRLLLGNDLIRAIDSHVPGNCFLEGLNRLGE